MITLITMSNKGNKYMIIELICLTTGIVVVHQMAVLGRVKENKKRLFMHEQINAEQVTSHQNTHQSILKIFNHLKSISQNHTESTTRN